MISEGSLETTTGGGGGGGGGCRCCGGGSGGSGGIALHLVVEEGVTRSIIIVNGYTPEGVGFHIYKKGWDVLGL